MRRPVLQGEVTGKVGNITVERERAAPTQREKESDALGGGRSIKGARNDEPMFRPPRV